MSESAPVALGCEWFGAFLLFEHLLSPSFLSRVWGIRVVVLCLCWHFLNGWQVFSPLEREWLCSALDFLSPLTKEPWPWIAAAGQNIPPTPENTHYQGRFSLLTPAPWLTFLFIFDLILVLCFIVCVARLVNIFRSWLIIFLTKLPLYRNINFECATLIKPAIPSTNWCRLLITLFIVL